jgi:hypothetical protein
MVKCCQGIRTNRHCEIRNEEAPSIRTTPTVVVLYLPPGIGSFAARAASADGSTAVRIFSLCSRSGDFLIDSN